MRVLRARRSAEEQLAHMERAYVDTESGRTICCWEAGAKEQLEKLFAAAGVAFESIACVAEIVEVDFP
jgi:hypothetical protein